MERPECFEFAMDFLGEPEGAKIRAYVASLELALAAERGAVAAERELCAKLCEDKGPELLRWWGDGQANAACQECATAIREAELEPSQTREQRIAQLEAERDALLRQDVA